MAFRLGYGNVVILDDVDVEFVGGEDDDDPDGGDGKWVVPVVAVVVEEATAAAAAAAVTLVILWTIRFRQSRLEPLAELDEG